MNDSLPPIELEKIADPVPKKPLPTPDLDLRWTPEREPTPTERMREWFDEGGAWPKPLMLCIGALLLGFLVWPIQRTVTVRGNLSVAPDNVVPLQSPMKGRITRLAAPKDRAVANGTPICWMVPVDDSTKGSASSRSYDYSPSYSSGSVASSDNRSSYESDMLTLRNHLESAQGNMRRATDQDTYQMYAREVQRIYTAMRERQEQYYREQYESRQNNFSGGQQGYYRSWDAGSPRQPGEVTIESPIEGFLVAHKCYGGAQVTQNQVLADLVPNDAPIQFEGGVPSRAASLIPEAPKLLTVRINGEDRPLKGIQVALVKRTPKVKDSLNLVDAPRNFWEANWNGLALRLQGPKVHELPLGQRIDLHLQSGYRPRVWHWWLNLIGA